MYEPTEADKIVINENNLKSIFAQIYDKTTACTVGKMAGNDEMVKNAEKALVILVKMKDGYNKVLSDLKKEN